MTKIEIFRHPLPRLSGVVRKLTAPVGCPTGEGVQTFGQPRTDGGGGLKFSILAGRPLWMAPKEFAQNLTNGKK